MPEKNAKENLAGSFEYSSADIRAPLRIPASSAMNMVAMALPLLLASARSTVQAKTVGELIPVEMPNNTAPMKKMNRLEDNAKVMVARKRLKVPINSSFTLPYLSEALPEKILVIIDMTSITLKKSPRFFTPRKSLKSGTIVNTIPKEYVVSSITMEDGNTLLSKISSFRTKSMDRLNFFVFGTDSFMKKIQAMLKNPVKDEIINMVFIPKFSASALPIAGPAAIPMCAVCCVVCGV
ncbi:MAG: hypothetical protein AAGC47_14080, partial [Bacteroidota bacterium]